MSFRPQASDVNSNVVAPEERDRASLLNNSDAATLDAGQYVPPATPQSDPIPMATSADIPEQVRMGGAFQKSGFRRADVVPYSGGKWEIVGEDSQLLLVKLEPGEELMVEPGGLLTKRSSTQPELSIGKLDDGFKRCCCAQESCFRVIWKPTESDVLTVTPYFPSKVLPIDLDNSGGLFIKKKAWMATIGRDTEFNAVLAPSLGTACCAGQGIFLTAIKGSGMAFLNVGGTVIQKVLEDGEQLVLDETSLVAWEQTVNLDIIRAGPIGVMCCGKQGLFNAHLTGPGLVIVQSMSFEKARNAYVTAAQGHKPKGGLSIQSEIV